MGEVAKNFISGFHNLPGETVKERQNNLFRLLHQNRSLNESATELAYITTNLKPSNHLEDIFLIDYLIYFKQFDRLYENFKNGHDITVKKLSKSKQDWFYQRAFSEISCDEFVNNILPTISHSLKLIILKRLPGSENKMDAFFDAIRDKYGVFLATGLLVKCSSQKIHQTLTTYPIKLTAAQLRLLYDKDPNLLDLYLQERKKLEGSSAFLSDNPILIYIAQKDPEKFSELLKKYGFGFVLGRRTTKKYIDSQKSKVLEKPETYFKILNKSSIIKKVGYEVRDLLFKKGISYWGQNWEHILKYYPKSQQFALFKSTYNSLYHEKFGDNFDAVSEEMLRIMPDAEEREQLARKKLEKGGGDDYLRYFTSENCFDKIMQKMEHGTASERASFVSVVTECSVRNKDLATLLKVCQMVNGRLKNDGANTRESFVIALVKDKTFLEKLEEQHWKLIFAILVQAHSKNEYLYGIEPLLQYYIRYLMKNNQPIKEMVQKYPKWENIVASYTLYSDREVFKALMTELVEIGDPKPNPDIENASALFDCSLVQACKSYNDDHPNDTIDIFKNPRIIQSVKQILMAENQGNCCSNYACTIAVDEAVSRPSTCEDMQEIKTLYFKEFKKFGRKEGLRWFLKNEPRTLLENFDHFLNCFVDVWGINTKRVWRYIKKYTHLELDTKAVDFCKQKLAEEGFAYKERLVKPLTFLTAPQAHLELVKQYIPTSDKVDLTDEDVKELYDIQGKMVKFLHLINSPKEVLSTTLEFCKGDYLQFALSPLYSCIYKLPENETKPFISKIDAIKALSVRKHAMHLSSVIYDCETVYNCFKTATVPSLTATIKYFAKNPSEALWVLIQQRIGSLEDGEMQLLKVALKIKVPLKHQPKYMNCIWKASEKYDNNEIKKLMFPQLDRTVIEEFDAEFGLKLIKKNIFKCEESHSLVARLLIYLKTEEKFTVLRNILTSFKKNCWENEKTKRAACRKLKSFVVIIFTTYIRAEEANEKFVSDLYSVFESLFALDEISEELIIIKCMNFKGENTENSVKILSELNRMFVGRYGLFAVNLLATTINSHVFYYVFKEDSDKVKLCHSLLQVKEEVGISLLIIRLMPTNNLEYAKDFALFQDILTYLNQVTDDVVQMQLNLYLKSGATKDSEWRPPICWYRC